MTGRTPDHSASLTSIPKIELHRHLEGSLRLSTIHDLVLREGLDLPASIDELRPLVQHAPGDPRTPQAFLSKFETLRLVFRTPEIIQRVVSEAIADAAAENIIYLELHFTPAALTHERGFDLEEVFGWVTEAAQRAAAQEHIQIGLIVSINRHEPLASGMMAAKTAADWMHNGVVGLGLAGDELGSPSEPFHPLLREAHQAGLGLTIHAGEWSGSDSVAKALDISPDVRIGHGVHVLENPDVVRLAVERRTVFEVCPTSNIQSGAVASAAEHPLVKMIEAGLQVTVNTDDPSVSQTTLADEYSLVVGVLGLSPETIKATILGSAQAAFQPAAIRKALESRLESTFFG